MNLLLFFLILPILCCIHGDVVHMRIPKTAKSSHPVSVETVRDNLQDKFWKDLYPEIIQLQSKTAYDILNLFTQQTLLQAHQVTEMIEEHANLTRLQAQVIRKTANSTEDLANCTVHLELGLLNAFKSTGYNVHNCIRTAQINFDQKYVEFNKKLEELKIELTRTFYFFNRTLENCVDKECPINIYVQAVTKIENLRDRLRILTLDVTGLHKNYIMNSVALGCVHNAFEQIRNNYKIGQKLLGNCSGNSQPI